ncbi:MAG: ATP-binding protein [Planctomycetota bacterium]
MAKRKIVEIDENKCSGCGLCVPACAEGALQIIDGKARLVSDVYCDGLGACLGDCPEGAITMTEREAVPFDEEAAVEHVARLRSGTDAPPQGSRESATGCPGAAPQSLQLSVVGQAPPPATDALTDAASSPAASQLGHWPIQLHLVPPSAPFLKNADLLLVADCVPFAMADFHGRFLRKRPVVIGCPKLDDPQAYVDKLSDMLTVASINSLTVVRMEVPCCSGLVRIAQTAMDAAGRRVPLEEVTISIRGRQIEAGESLY